MEHVDSLLDLVSTNIADIAKSDVVVGEAIELGDITIVPLSRVSIGFGGGGGEGEGTQSGPRRRRRGKGDGGAQSDASSEAGQGKGAGGGAGGGGKVRPVGVIIFSSEGVEITPIPDKLGIFDKIFEKVPDIIDLVKDAQKS